MRSSFFSNFRSNSTANSRASSPPSRPDSGVFVSDVVDPLSLPPLVMAPPAGTPAFGSGVSNQPGPQANAHRARPISRLSFTPFRRGSPSPAPTQGSTPSMTPMASNTPGASPSQSPAINPASFHHYQTSSNTVGPGSSYLDSLSLKLGEGVQKALLLPLASSSSGASNHHHGASIGLGKSSSLSSLSAGTTKSGSGLGLIHHHGTHGVATDNVILKGKKPVPVGRGRVLGLLISSELHNASHVLHDAYLHRAILRLLQRPLTNLLTNLSQCVTALILSPEFAPIVPLLSLNPTQIHALAYAGFASELLETLDALNLGRSSSHLQVHTSGGSAGGDGLKPIREGLENVVSRVVGPLLSAIRSELMTIVDEVELAGKTPGADAGSAVEKLEQAICRVGGLVAYVTFVPPEQVQHIRVPQNYPGGVTVTQVEPSTGAVCRQSTHVQSLLATFEIGTMWTCLKALSLRKIPTSHGSGDDHASLDAAPKGRAPFGSHPSAPLKYQASDGSLSVSSTESTSSAGDLGRMSGIQLPLAYVTPPGTPQIGPALSPTKVEGKEIKRSSTLGMNLSLGLGSNKSATRLPVFGTSTTKVTTPVTSTTKLPTPPGTTKFGLAKLPSLKSTSPTASSTPSSRAPSPHHDTLQPHGLISSPANRPSHGMQSTPVPIPVLIELQLLAHDARLITGAIKRNFPLPAFSSSAVHGQSGCSITNLGLAREAVEEAIEKMDGFVDALEYVKEDGGRTVGLSPTMMPVTTSTTKTVSHRGPTVDVDALMQRTRNAPMLLILPILLRIWVAECGGESNGLIPPEVSSWIGLAEDEYVRSCLGGFGKAEECAGIVGRALLGSKAMKEMNKSHPAGSSWFQEWVMKSVEEAEDSDDDDDDTYDDEPTTIGRGGIQPRSG